MNDIYRLYYKGDVNMIGVWEEVWSKDKSEEVTGCHDILVGANYDT